MLILVRKYDGEESSEHVDQHLTQRLALEIRLLSKIIVHLTLSQVVMSPRSSIQDLKRFADAAHGMSANLRLTAIHIIHTIPRLLPF